MDPDDEIREFEKTMKRMMESLFGEGVGFFPFTPMRISHRRRMPGVREPLTDVNETKDEVIVTMELPGASKDNIELDVTEEGIEISARTQKFSKEEGATSSSMTQFRKYMSLPTAVDPNSARAVYKNGILEVKLKKTKKTKGKKVKVQ